MQGRKKLFSSGTPLTLASSGNAQSITSLPLLAFTPELSLEPIVICLGESSSSAALEPIVTCFGEPNSGAYLETKVNGIDPAAVNSFRNRPHQHRQLGSAAYSRRRFPPHCRGHLQHPHLRQLKRPGVVHAACLCPERLRC
ncbi:BZ3500_MvSof-1268-A1-R1_Chr2-2g05055 [Microbotryum saponariae]|uniref:BZ3500_MvSof-1268-A1-R1_Chr2-2g05055 protein n=1 Tax=Microbotryum saponariae TaxID=289078 RepID=A0A2X0K5C3_9BASI|nr:BZ3500_MvSof-1268-A1-R1_Chr2-2g05055 [Microbotryum saponariae]SDA00797.1 BZ3501_MvSof-1269-A2-R1_Chr2-2g04729 [Microbotryum saponariae]